MISRRLADIRVSPIKQFEYKASQYSDVVSLAQGIPSFDTPDVIKDNVKAAIDQGLAAHYSLPHGLPALRDLIEQILARDGMYYDHEREIIVTCGAIEALSATFLTLLDGGDEVILFSPSYASYPEVIKIANGKPVFSPLIEAAGWRLDLNDLRRRITKKTKAILVCNPNNPTGTVLSETELQALGRLALEHNIYLIMDEVYKDFIYTETPFYHLAAQSELRDTIIRIFSLSKSYSMTGWRIAFLHSSASITAEILKVHDSLVTCAPVVSQYGAYAALEKGSEAVREFKAAFEKRKELIERRLDRMADYFSYQNPNASYFVFPKVTVTAGANSWNFCLQLLEQARVALVPGSAFGPTGEGHVRMSFGRSEETINKAFDRLEHYFKTL